MPVGYNHVGVKNMREWKSTEIEEQIAAKMPEINRDILRSGKERTVRRRPRDPEEQRVLDHLCICRWEKAVAEGKVKILNEREWYYGFD